MAKEMKQSTLGNNFFVPCKYCKDFVAFDSGRFGDTSYGCKIRTNADGEYASLTSTPSPLGRRLFDRGCDDFISSGATIHPIVLGELAELNPRLKTVPVDDFVSDPYGIEDQLREHLPKENFIRKNTIVDIPESEIIKSR